MTQDARDVDWNIFKNADGSWPANQVTIAVLMDIRRELREIEGMMLQLPRMFREAASRAQDQATPIHVKPTKKSPPKKPTARKRKR